LSDCGLPQSAQREDLGGAPDNDFRPTDTDTPSRATSNNESEKITVSNCCGVSFLTWNVNGLWSKMFDLNFLSFVKQFDVVCFVETFLLSSNLDIFARFGYSVFSSPAVKLSREGRPSGGVVCLFKKEIAKYVTKVEVSVGHFLMFIIDKKLLQLSKDILFTCAYIPPERSPYYTYLDVEGNGVSMLENILYDILLDRDVFVCICGDLNSRTSSISQIFDQDIDSLNELHVSGSIMGTRCSQDNVLNNYGKSLLNLCTALDLCILNGQCEGDLEGCYTYISENGSSVIDYFLLSNELFALWQNYTMLNIIERIETNHLPVSLTVKISTQNSLLQTSIQTAQSNYVDVYQWNESKESIFKAAALDDVTKQQLHDAMNTIDIDVNLALEKFHDCLKNISVCMKKRKRIGEYNKQQDWFDIECKNTKKDIGKLLKRYRKSLSYEDRVNYCRQRKKYKNMLRLKKKQFNENMINKLILSVNNQKEFWDTVRNIIPKRNKSSNHISADDWVLHFKGLLEHENCVVDSHTTNDNNINADANDLSLNRPIGKDEVELAVRKLKLKKAAGPDGLISEIFKNAQNLVVDFFHIYLNKLFDSGVYPDSWCESVILPLYKKGDTNNPSNYRGISLSNVSSKIYGFIINRRLQAWVEEIDLTGEYQAGFKAGYSTIDHIFTLLACVQKQFSNNRKLYVAFIDFQKCFDTINRQLLWPILLKNGIKGKILSCIKSMYVSVKARIKCSDGRLTESINCSMGVKQGDICSPILFSIFINELTQEVISKGKHGVTLSQELFELFILLLADDVVLLSETVVGLQNQLHCLERTARALNLVVNLEKSNIVVFRKGGFLASRERWFFEGVTMPIVNIYKYLGIYFSTKLSFTASGNDLASKGKRALLVMMHRLRMFNNRSVHIFFKLFDSHVLPIMMYGSEIWGLGNAANICEKTHLFALKKFLVVDMRTPNDLVYKELNRYPISINCKINCIRYWLKIIAMNFNRLPRKAYLMLCNIDNRGKQNWVTEVRSFLCQFGFGEVWYNQGVGNIKAFLKELKVRLIDCRWQNWSEHVHESYRFGMYLTLSSSTHDIPKYLDLNLDKYLTILMTKFRFGISDLLVHYYRYRQLNDNRLLCPLCKVGRDDEMHLVFYCPCLATIRAQFIPQKYYSIGLPSDLQLSLLFNSQNPVLIRKLCLFLHQAFKMRSQFKGTS
jgi:hypothetical protein